MNSKPSLTVIVPLYAPTSDLAIGLVSHYKQLIQRNEEFLLTIIISDCSPPDIFTKIEQAVADSGIIHLAVTENIPDGDNKKLHAIDIALKHLTSRAVLIMDDDARPRIDDLTKIDKLLQVSRYVKCIPEYPAPSVFDYIDISGIFVVNMTSPHKQFWANIAFDVPTLLSVGFPEKNVLFDELAIELAFRRGGHLCSYCDEVAIPMYSHRGFKKFWEQRLRYAYENMGYPMRFATHLLALPLLVAIGIKGAAYCACALIAISLAVSLLSLAGQLKYDHGRHSRFTWMYATLWFWPYVIMSWLSLFARLRGGVRFGPTRIKTAV